MSIAKADDWPEMQGKGRQSAWDEKGILRKFPQTGLNVQWRVPIHAGYSGPAVADGRVFVSDYQKLQPGGVERVVCLDEKTGRILWTYQNPQVAYNKFTYNSGPRATPTVDGDRVYVLGGAGDLYCLNVRTGALRWGVSLPYRFHAKMPTWGFASAPIVFGDLLICQVGGQDDARIVAFNKITGRVIWHALPPISETGYSSPILVRAGGTTQLIHWGLGEIVSLNPQTGALYWRQSFPGNLACPTPIADGDKLFVTAFFDGPLMLKLAADRPAAELLWQGKDHSDAATDGLHSMIGTPAIKDGYIYGVCSYGQFRCLNAITGERIWESLEVVREKARWGTAFIVRNRDVYFINNDRGELIIADLSPKGYHELSRTELIKPTSGGAGSRERKLVNWTIPAYANRHIITRNDEEIIRASLAE